MIFGVPQGPMIGTILFKIFSVIQCLHLMI